LPIKIHRKNNKKSIFLQNLIKEFVGKIQRNVKNCSSERMRKEIITNFNL